MVKLSWWKDGAAFAETMQVYDKTAALAPVSYTSTTVDIRYGRPYLLVGGKEANLLLHPTYRAGYLAQLRAVASD